MMNAKAWQALKAARKDYKDYVAKLEKRLPFLRRLEQSLIDRRSGPSYTVQNPVLYNHALDELGPDDDIRLILVADNPGRREQENGRYLVGPSGKIADSFFKQRPELGIDFRRNVVILNKTPIHTPRTAELRKLIDMGGSELERAVAGSQEFMARVILAFHRALAPVPVWIIGYSEMKKGGVFEVFTGTIERLYKGLPSRQKELFLFRHFSMNQFTIDLKQQAREGETSAAALERIGSAYRKRIFPRL
jgi:hypothetical protein